MIREAASAVTPRNRLLENRLKIAIGRCDGIDGIATWRTQEAERLDQASLKSERPDIFKMYSKSSRVRVLRIV